MCQRGVLEIVPPIPPASLAVRFSPTPSHFCLPSLYRPTQVVSDVPADAVRHRREAAVDPDGVVDAAVTDRGVHRRLEGTGRRPVDVRQVRRLAVDRDGSGGSRTRDDDRGENASERQDESQQSRAAPAEHPGHGNPLFDERGIDRMDDCVGCV